MRGRKDRQKNKATTYDNSMALERVLPSRTTDLRITRAIAFFLFTSIQRGHFSKIATKYQLYFVYTPTHRDRQTDREIERALAYGPVNSNVLQ